MHGTTLPCPHHLPTITVEICLRGNSTARAADVSRAVLEVLDTMAADYVPGFLRLDALPPILQAHVASVRVCDIEPVGSSAASMGTYDAAEHAAAPATTDARTSSAAARGAGGDEDVSLRALMAAAYRGAAQEAARAHGVGERVPFFAAAPRLFVYQLNEDGASHEHIGDGTCTCARLPHALRPRAPSATLTACPHVHVRVRTGGCACSCRGRRRRR